MRQSLGSTLNIPIVPRFSFDLLNFSTKKSFRTKIVTSMVKTRMIFNENLYKSFREVDEGWLDTTNQLEQRWWEFVRVDENCRSNASNISSTLILVWPGCKVARKYLLQNGKIYNLKFQLEEELNLLKRRSAVEIHHKPKWHVLFTF